MLPIPYLVKIPFGYVVINQIYSLIQPKPIVNASKALTLPFANAFQIRNLA